MSNLHRIVNILFKFMIHRQESSADCLQFQSMRISLGKSFPEIPQKSLTSAKIILFWKGLRRALVISWQGSGLSPPGASVLSPTNRSTIPEIRTDEAIHLPNETPRPRFPDRLPRPWTRSPERIPDPNILDKGIPGHFPQIPPVKGPGLPFLPNVKDVAGSAFPEIRGKNPFLSSKELDTLISNPLPGSRPIAQFMGEGPDPAIGDMANNFFENVNKRAVPVNAQVANRPSLSVISIIAIQLCAFIYFN